MPQRKIIPSASGQSDFGLAVHILGAIKPSQSSQGCLLSCTSQQHKVLNDSDVQSQSRSPFRNVMGQVVNQSNQVRYIGGRSSLPRNIAHQHSTRSAHSIESNDAKSFISSQHLKSTSRQIRAGSLHHEKGYFRNAIAENILKKIPLFNEELKNSVDSIKNTAYVNPSSVLLPS